MSISNQPQGILRKLATSAVVIAATTCLLVEMRALREREDKFVPPAKSIESARVAVERGLDFDTRNIAMKPQAISLTELLAIPRPKVLVTRSSDSSENRLAPFETQVWRLHALVGQAMLRDDGDFYLTVTASGKTGSVEIPDPEVCGGSPFIRSIRAVRAQLERELHPEHAPKLVNRWADLTGIGFFGTAARGANGARLMPLLELNWTR